MQSLTIEPTTEAEHVLESLLFRRFGTGLERYVRPTRRQALRFGLDAAARPEKTDMVRRLLAGKAGLRIYETCGFKSNGDPGHLTAVYREHGCVTSRATHEGRYLRLAGLEVAAGRKYDVVDHDPWTTKFEDVPVIAELVKPGGLLILTWASQWHRFPARRRQAIGYFGTERPTKRDYARYVNRVVPSTCVAYVEYGRAIVRAAFRLKHT